MRRAWFSAAYRRYQSSDWIYAPPGRMIRRHLSPFSQALGSLLAAKSDTGSGMQATGASGSKPLCSDWAGM